MSPALRIGATGFGLIAVCYGFARFAFGLFLPQIDGEGPDARFDFQGESDAMIVRGLIAILHALYAGLPAREVIEVDAGRELARLGLNDHLSAQRSNGLRAMVERIRTIAGRTAAAA